MTTYSQGRCYQRFEGVRGFCLSLNVHEISYFHKYAKYT